MNATTLSALSYKLLIIGFLAAFLAACSDDDDPTTYRVTFDTDGGEPKPATQTIEQGKTAAKPPTDPTKTGYTFDDWYTDKTFTTVFDFDTTRIVTDTTVFAQFTINAYTVSFNTDGGSNFEDQNIAYNGNATRPPSDPTKTGYTFDGWYTDNTFATAFDFANTAITADTEVFAKFTNAYTVRFDTDGAVTEQTVTHGDQATMPDAPTKSGHYFMGDWYTDAASAASATLNAAASATAVANRFDFNAPITGSITLYAFFKTIEQPTGDTDEAKIDALRTLIAKGQVDARIGNTGDFNWIDVSGMTNMSDDQATAPTPFRDNKTFNGDISKWDVSKVTNMSRMFLDAEAFNGDISKWDVGKVQYMDQMFLRAKAFNGDISGWDVSSVEGMFSMFNAAASFNQDLSKWDVSNVTDMRFMFVAATSFNQDLSGWDVSKVTTFGRFSDGATAWTKPKPNFN